MLSNPIGDLRAESDALMLDAAFVETSDYKTLIGSSERCIVVGRRGSGKSALVYRLLKHWRSDQDLKLVQIANEEDQVIGVRPFIERFGSRFTHLRAGSRIVWRYALLMEIAAAMAPQYRFSKRLEPPLSDHLARWRGFSSGSSSRLYLLMRGLGPPTSPSAAIGELAHTLEVDEIQNAVLKGLKSAKTRCAILIDKLDEGYEPDPLGVGMVDGLIQASIDSNTRLEDQAHCTLFVRDNIFRAVAQLDPDYSRNIEGQVLRLHWDEYQLMAVIANRIRVAFNLEPENDLKAWNRCTARELRGRDGFRKCLQLTLYRPRDIISLLNQAFHAANKQDRQQLIETDLDSTAREISSNRLDDLHKEYEAIFPGLLNFTNRFANTTREHTVADVYDMTRAVISQDIYEPDVQQHFAILENPEQVAHALCSIGFLGTKDTTSGNYVFCHDGSVSTHGFGPTDQLLVHPCYWMALSLTGSPLEAEKAQEIFDEYDIEVTSDTPEIRSAQLGRMIGELDRLEEGTQDAAAFEEWCHLAIRVLWGGHLRNVELRPNRNATQRRDVVATNLSESGSWQRIRQDHGTRQVVFEVKNFSGLGPQEFRQMLSYLTGDYGSLGFIVTRDQSIDVQAGSELEWIREFWARTPRVLVVRLTARWIAKQLSRLRGTRKHDEPERQLGKLLDTYVRLYVGGQVKKRRRKRVRSKGQG